jgi:hypothetical protein
VSRVKRFGRRDPVTRSFTTAPHGTQQHWEDVQELVYSLRAEIGRSDPSSSGGTLSRQFGLLVTAGVRDDVRFDSAEAIQRRAAELGTVVVGLGVLKADPELKDDIELTCGGYWDLLAAWTQTRGNVLAYILGPRLHVKREAMAGPVSFDSLADEGQKLVQLLVGIANPIPHDEGFPGIFHWLVETHGTTEKLYADWSRWQ